MQILINNEVYNFKSETSDQSNLIEKLNNLEKGINELNPLLNSTFLKLKKECTIIYDKEYLRFLFFTEEEKELIKLILKKGNENFYFCFKLKNNYELIFGQYTYSERQALLNKHYGYLSKEYKEYLKYEKNYYRRRKRRKKNKDEELLEYEDFLEKKLNIELPDENTQTFLKLRINLIEGLNLKKGRIDYENGTIDKIFNLIFKDKYDLVLKKEKKFGNKGKYNFLTSLRLKDMILKNERINQFLKIIFISYLKELEKENFFIKDILKDYQENENKLYVPIEFKLLSKAKNKKHLLEMKMSTSSRKNYPLFNRFNKISLNTAYSLIKITPYIKENDIKKLDNFEYDNFSDNENSRIIVFLKEYIRTTRKKGGDEYYWDEIEVEDYIRFLKYFKSKEKFNFNVINENILKREHDRLSNKYVLAKYKKENLEIAEDNEFLKLEMPKDIKRLETKGEFYSEGRIQRNCVFSYIREVNKGNCMIYTMFKDNKKYTIEIRKNKNGYFIHQLKGFANSEAPVEVETYLKNVINENNERLGYKNN